MGGACGKASKDAAKYRRASIRPGTESAYKTGPLSRKAIVQRLSVVDAKETEYGPGFKICYAAVSQRGYYPEALNKANQDSYLIQPTGMGNMKGKGLFGVFDGHGPKGHLCSGFVKEKLPGNMQMFCTADPSTKYKEFLRGFSNAFTETNIQMHENVDINDKMSGTTAIVAFVDGCTVYTANIGDSRAIIAYNQDGKLRVAALSMDQTPFRYDERERVKRAGARVMTMDQIEGSEPIHENWGLNLGDEIDSEGNPPRIWSQVGNYPGCAFTRSLGDQVAETLGVYAEPEILRRDIRPTDKFIILASDGVFEFLTSQAVAELGDQFEHPVEACRSICAEAYRMWMTYEVRTDDITVVMLQFKIDAEYFDVAQLPAMDSQSPGHALRVLRPVRRGLSKAKRKAIMGRRMTANDGREGKFVVSEHVVDKTEEQADEIRAAIRANFLFAHMNAKQIEDVVRMMEPETVAAGEVLIHQGSSGDFLYMVEHGNFDVYVKKGPSEEQGPEGDGPHAALGTLVHTYISSSEVHPVFGELALMYAKPRAASVVAQTDGKLWRLKRRAFRHIVMKSAHEDLHKTLKKVAVLSGLNKNELQRLADVMAEVSFAKDEPIVKQGDVGDTMFVIKEGSVVCRIEDRDDDGNVQIKDVLTLGANDYFGERAILHDEPRAASVIATKNGTVCFEISRKLFEEVLGSLDAIINEDRKQREKKGMERAQNFKRRIYIEEGGSKTDSFSFSSQNLELSGIEQLLPLGKVADIDDVKVFLCQYKINSVRMTVKVVSKSDVLKQGTEDNVVREKELLAALSCTPTVDSPCLPRLVATYHVGAQLCMLLDAQCICSLASLLEDSLFSENDAKFAAMLLLQALRQLHRPGDLTSPRKAMRRVARGQTGRGNGGGGSGGSGGGRGAATKLEGVMLRGLTPEHVMIDAQGYPCICDFRLAKRLGHDDATYTLCGTPEYLAPEIIGGQGHSFAVDYWAMGVLIFEMTSGKTPFRETETSPELQIYARATNHKKNSHHLEFPENASMELQVLVRNLLDPDADARMNYGLEATSSSSWFESLGDFERLRKKAANSPYLEALRPKARKMNASGEQNQLFDDRHTATQPEGEDWSVFDDF